MDTMNIKNVLLISFICMNVSLHGSAPSDASKAKKIVSFVSSAQSPLSSDSDSDNENDTFVTPPRSPKTSTPGLEKSFVLVRTPADQVHVNEQHFQEQEGAASATRSAQTTHDQDTSKNLSPRSQNNKRYLGLTQNQVIGVGVGAALCLGTLYCLLKPTRQRRH